MFPWETGHGIGLVLAIRYRHSNQPINFATAWSSHHYIGEKLPKMIKPTATLVNLSRGPVYTALYTQR